MAPHAFNSSNAADRKAKKEGRFFGGKVYDNKRSRDAAARAASATGRNPGPSRSLVPRTGRVVEQVEDTWTHNVTTTSKGWKAWKIAGPRANVLPALVALRARNPRIQGARIHVQFTNITNAFGRWSQATVHQLSAGPKSAEVVGAVRGAFTSHDTLALSTWITVKDIAVVPVKEDTAGTDLLVADENRSVVIAVESTSTVTVTATIHLTVLVDHVANGQAPVDL